MNLLQFDSSNYFCHSREMQTATNELVTNVTEAFAALLVAQVAPFEQQLAQLLGILVAVLVAVVGHLAYAFVQNTLPTSTANTVLLNQIGGIVTGATAAATAVTSTASSATAPH